ncbi:hypothetical protein TNCV_1760251 [Trichonephila clavipes]|nr:hypothetical protein TNCV_1760251 [Trichonephila clavipes]
MHQPINTVGFQWHQNSETHFGNTSSQSVIMPTELTRPPAKVEEGSISTLIKEETNKMCWIPFEETRVSCWEFESLMDCSH